MHAGDGNIHVNIPVFSNDREMMIRAAETADVVMAKAVELGGAVSGEHGIGFTKFKYLDKGRIDALTRYRQTVDPDGIMNPGKLSDRRASQLVFAPSFNLLELEASILRHAELEALAEQISGCVRCGRCKTPCCVFHPQENLFYHPRNKNLAVVALIEAILYETQRFRSTGFNALQYLNQVPTTAPSVTNVSRPVRWTSIREPSPCWKDKFSPPAVTVKPHRPPVWPWRFSTAGPGW